MPEGLHREHILKSFELLEAPSEAAATFDLPPDVKLFGETVDKELPATKKVERRINVKMSAPKRKAVRRRKVIAAVIIHSLQNDP